MDNRTEKKAPFALQLDSRAQKKAVALQFDCVVFESSSPQAKIQLQQHRSTTQIIKITVDMSPTVDIYFDQKYSIARSAVLMC